MKTQLSRISRQKFKQYSSVCHQQGRMLTDSDLTEQALISRDRLSQALQDVIGSGTPRHGALLQLSAIGEPELHWGKVYVDGVPAVVQPVDMEGASEDKVLPEELYIGQLHYPVPPELPQTPYRLYLDVWERPVIWLQDEMLRDPGLHGADTTTRTQTVAQVKWSDGAKDPLCEDINPTMGDARLRLVLRSLSSSPDPCDPCADELNLYNSIGNYLFRVEIHDVSYDENDQPDGVVLKWSSENGAEAYKHSDTPPDFAANAFVYEYFDEVTEQHQGAHLARNNAGRMIDGKRLELSSTFPNAALTKDYVRRWDGWCELKKTGTDWKLLNGFDGSVALSVGSLGSPGHVVEEGGIVTIELRFITLAIELGNRPLLTGDYWTAPVRESIHQEGEILLADGLDEGETLAPGVPPQGEQHHYMLLVDVAADGTMLLPTGSECDAYNACKLPQFPSLTDLRADDVCYATPECDSEVTLLSHLQQKSPLQGDIKNWLDNILCHTNAATIPLDSDSPLCETYKEAEVRTVQDALNLFCDFKSNGCSTITLNPKSDWVNILEKIPANTHVHICFHPGEYNVPKTLHLKNLGHVKISCVSEGSLFVYHLTEAVFSFEKCKSVTIDGGVFLGGKSGLGKPDDDTYDHLRGALSFIDCLAVNLHSVVAKCVAASAVSACCISIHNASNRLGQTRISGCRFEVGNQQIGILALNQQRVSINDNLIKSRPHTKQYSFEHTLKDTRVMKHLGKLMLQNSAIRNFEKIKDDNNGKGFKNLLVGKGTDKRQIKFKSPIPKKDWERSLNTMFPDHKYATNNELLNAAKYVAKEVMLKPEVRASFLGFKSWFEDIKQQSPAIMSKGVVCAGEVMEEVRILDNTFEQVQLGIQLATSNRNKKTAKIESPQRVGNVLIRGNSIGVRFTPLVTRRRGGLFVGNCKALVVRDNVIKVTRENAVAKKSIEGMRVFGDLGRKIIIKDNETRECNIGILIQPITIDPNLSYQWLVADNLFAETPERLMVVAPEKVKNRENIS